MFRRLGASIRKWMYGRYGSDQLNMLLLVLAVILSLTNTILTYAMRTMARISRPYINSDRIGAMMPR